MAPKIFLLSPASVGGVRDADALLDFLAGLDGVFDAPPPLGDPIDLLQHGLQCAAVLRASHPDDLGLQLAGLVHDIGHATGDVDHAADRGLEQIRHYGVERGKMSVERCGRSVDSSCVVEGASPQERHDCVGGLAAQEAFEGGAFSHGF